MRAGRPGTGKWCPVETGLPRVLRFSAESESLEGGFGIGA